MADERPSILARFRGDLVIERDPEKERRAREFTEALMERVYARLADPAPTQLAFDREKLDTAVNAAKWFIPTALMEFLDFEGKIAELRQLRREVANDRSMSSGERKQKLLLIERKIASGEQWKIAINGVFSFGIREWDILEGDLEQMNKVAAAIVTVVELLREGVGWGGIHIWQTDEKGTRVDRLADWLRRPGG